jgi:hypothetical protein
MLLSEPDVAVRDSDQEYLDNLWWMLHHSDDGTELVMAFTSYLDDSGSDTQSPITVIGGPVFSLIQCKAFSRRWSALLKTYPIEEPLHMTDFARPHGKHSGMYPEIKLNLFTKVAKLINDHKHYSFSASVPQVDFRTILSEDVCKTVVGPYAFVFFTAVMINLTLGSKKGFSKVAYLVDSGSAFKEQLIDAHAAVRRAEDSRERQNTGALGFDVDDRVQALQAADVIAWSGRRMEVGTLTEEFEPLNAVLAVQRPPHLHLPLPVSAIKMLANPIKNWIAKRGSIPSLQDIITP